MALLEACQGSGEVALQGAGGYGGVVTWWDRGVDDKGYRWCRSGVHVQGGEYVAGTAARGAKEGYREDRKVEKRME